MPLGPPPPEENRQEYGGCSAFIMTGGGERAQAQLPARPAAPGLRRGTAVEGGGCAGCGQCRAEGGSGAAGEEQVLEKEAPFYFQRPVTLAFPRVLELQEAGPSQGGRVGGSLWGVWGC